MAYLYKVEVNGLWGIKNILWENINEDINIIVGINGSGKTTLLNIIWKSILNGGSLKKNAAKDEFCVFAGSPVRGEFISTFDVLSSHKKKSESPLTLDLLDLIYTTGQSKNTFFDYRLKATNYPKQAKQINERIQSFFKLINKQFASTNKTIEIDPQSNKLVFKQKDSIIQLEQLSSGEKQFLLIMFKAFLMEEKPYILLMDEPEISMHIDWQFELINTIRELNPKCQIIIATHSPGMFGDGWGDKVVYMEDITSDVE